MAIRIRTLPAALVLGFLWFTAKPVTAQDAFLGEIRMFAGTYAPPGWALCDGRLLQIAQNQALFSLLGATYGGDGRTTFALPDLRGRVPMHAGQAPGLTVRKPGDKGGAEMVAPPAGDPGLALQGRSRRRQVTRPSSRYPR
jgi:hypothetical protein